jgi:hypothetical protein
MTGYLILTSIPTSFGILALLVGLGLVTPSWRWVVAVIVLIGAALIYIWLMHWYATTLPGYKESPGGGLGIMIVGTVSWAFLLASVMYIVGLIWWRNRS